jgi:5-methylcytosine-specific restriction endonuclease McrA
MNQNYVFVLDTNKQPLSPCTPRRARELMSRGKAAVFRRYPFTLILKRPVEDAQPQTCQVKIDPGSKTTGLALVQGDKVIWGGEVTHRGSSISQKLEKRSQWRRNRRGRIRHRHPKYKTKAQNNNAKRDYKNKRKLQPSLQHRVDTTMTWVYRLMRYAPVGELTQELVRFDMQKMENPEISGVEYQQGTLYGYETKEYLLEKWDRKCAYCGASGVPIKANKAKGIKAQPGVPLEVDHIHPRSKNGPDRVSNLTLACRPCNLKKSNRPVQEFLAKKPDVLKRVLAWAKAPLRDAAAVNSTRWALYRVLETTGLPVTVGTGGRTKFNRKQLGWRKAHWLDAAAVGSIGDLILATESPLLIVCKGQGGRQKDVLNKYGRVRINKKGQPQRRPLKPIHGWRSGDIGKCDGVVGRVTPRTSGSFSMLEFGKDKPFTRPMRFFIPVHRNDGYMYGG